LQTVPLYTFPALLFRSPGNPILLISRI